MAIFIFSVNGINRLLLSFLVLTKVITLSGVHCTMPKETDLEVVWLIVL